MGSRSSQTLPPALEAGRQCFEQWRRERPSGRSRIPPPLWARAATLAKEFGVHRTARALRLNYDTLKARVNGDSPPSSLSDATISFVELFPDALGTPRCPCVVELEDGRGGRMRVQLEQANAPLLAALASAFLRGGS